MKKQLLSLIATYLISLAAFAQPGTTCDNALMIGSLPFQDVQSTGNFSNTISGPQGNSCGNTPAATNYLQGNDVFYKYIPSVSGNVSFIMTPIGSTYSSMFIYEGCSNVGVSCIGGAASPNTNARSVTLSLTAGTTYIILISSSANTPGITYNLLLQDEACGPKPANPSVSAITDVSANLTWNAGTFSSWEVAVQPAGGMLPSGAGIPVNTNNYAPELQPHTSYEYWVRAKCTDNTDAFTAWSGPVAFNSSSCNPSNACTYRFMLFESGNDGWNGARMQVRQNGIVIATLGNNYFSSSAFVNVSLCNNEPFDVYWLTEGSDPYQCKISILNASQQCIYVMPQGAGNAGDIVYTGMANCSPVCNSIPQNFHVTQVTATNAVLIWGSPATDSWDIFVTTNPNEIPSLSTVPTYNDVTEDFFTITDLVESTYYYAYVRNSCDVEAPWVKTAFLTHESCLKPFVLGAGNATTTSATLTWQYGTPTDNAWEILLIPSDGVNIPVPPDNPVLQPGWLLLSPDASPYVLPAGTLTNATRYFYFIRTVCSSEDKSSWAGPYIFNTVTCDASEKCNYKFELTCKQPYPSWYGAEMQVRQNGIVVATLANAFTNPEITVPLCNGVPFDLLWSVAGTHPLDIGVEIRNAYNDSLFTSGHETPLTVLYSGVADCTPPTCPKPTALAADAIAATTAHFTWTETGTASQWEIFVAPVGSTLPVNGNPLNSGGFYHVVDTASYNAAGLLPLTDYVAYVRAVCSSNDTGNWTLVNPLLFTTKPANDECADAIVVPVNPTMNEILYASGSTEGASTSSQSSSSACQVVTALDVWFSFVATSKTHFVKISNVDPSTQTVFFSVYSGSDCQNLQPLFCGNGNTSFASNFVIGNTYKIRVYTSSGLPLTPASFNVIVTTPNPATNDLCSDAIEIPVNNGVCDTVVFGSMINATTSPFTSTCGGGNTYDVWFKFTAISNSQIISLLDFYGSGTDVKHAIYTGSCGNMQLFYCSNTREYSKRDNYIVGQTYYLRISASSQSVPTCNFNICIKSLSTCENAESYCGSATGEPFIFANTSGTPNDQQVACLGSIPNPTFYKLRIGQSGPITFDIVQNELFDSSGNPIGQYLDVDYVAWGPFADGESCDQILMAECATCPNNTNDPAFYPYGNIVDCSYASSFTETLHIPNAVAGEYYVLLITNYNGDPGYVSMRQSNFGQSGAGSTVCGDKIQLVAFLDENGNGIKDNAEVNFTKGNFTYQKNGLDPAVNIATSNGQYNLYDFNAANTYDFNFHVFPEFAGYYAVAATDFSNISIPAGSGVNTLYFPVTLMQAYEDLSVSITPESQPLAGDTYVNKIIYKNEGTSTISGTLTFTKDVHVVINSIAQAGTIATASGFTYAFTALEPSETRSFNVVMNVPPLPVVNINDMLSNAVSISGAAADVNLPDNTATVTQAVSASFDPNDKTESHGGIVDIAELNNDGYLFYTIRFQNTGTAIAKNIRLEDTLDSQLDANSLRMVSASHPYVLEGSGNHLTWHFDNIGLSPEIADADASHGYVTFKVRPKTGFAVADVISNTAGIYFDSNPAIETNTVQTEISAFLGIQTFDLSNIHVYPNPANTMVYVSLQHTAENLGQVALYDVLGNTVKKVEANHNGSLSIDISGLAKGVYLLEVSTMSHSRLIKKLIVD
ncbi:DUF7619 domain-containing protein [Flavobacterium pallidum]|uniref:Fibronectin type-III domain-containing protein n=1 Tax=Flavobacterium pallidum TaxID=2172098 RepID=A0A2S1SDW4_9FLAO|nr:T9SS type A sorting domain-containing protein [Flavobacterium pallidum]AWI24586.1 hypothetical protein HYN49_01030 [Flavobacterium pallidum]